VLEPDDSPVGGKLMRSSLERRCFEMAGGGSGAGDSRGVE
jgi:hypothetical protein